MRMFEFEHSVEIRSGDESALTLNIFIEASITHAGCGPSWDDPGEGVEWEITKVEWEDPRNPGAWNAFAPEKPGDHGSWNPLVKVIDDFITNDDFIISKMNERATDAVENWCNEDY